MSRTVAWTGHRPDLFRDPPAARSAVHATARELADAGVTRFFVGGQRGVDTWAAQAAIECAVPFTLILPFQPGEFTREWSIEDRRALESLMQRADEVRIAGSYTERNQQLAGAAELLVAVWTRTRGGGTAETVDLAQRLGVRIREIVLDPADSAQSATGRGI